MTASRARPLLSVLLVTYNSTRHLPDSLGSIHELVSSGEAEALVWDNNSADSSVRLVQELCPEARVTSCGDNVGFAAAVNALASAAAGDVLLFLNPDCAVSTADARALANALRSEPRYGVLSPAVLDAGAGLRPTRSAGWDITLPRALVHALGLSNYWKGIYARPNLGVGPVQVEWVGGACLFVSQDVFTRLGGLTERWFMYSEDLELCRRARAAGYMVILDTDITVRHVGGGSFAASSNVVNVMWLQNLIDYYEQGRSRASRFRAACLAATLGLGFASRYAAASLAAVAGRGTFGERRHEFQAYTRTSFRESKLRFYLKKDGTD